jgi:c-di-AMP phosphodiesterase-like protein
MSQLRSESNELLCWFGLYFTKSDFLSANVKKLTFSSIRNVSSKNKEILVLGHRNPDTDAITAAIVYADFLNRMKVNAKAYRLGDLNNETKFVLKTADIQAPEMLPDTIPDGTEVALVDHNESKLSGVYFILNFFVWIFRSTINGKCEENAGYSCY